ncbi:uncharacterized protein V6R79_002084 [Siganus canaliculatus]
MASGGGDEDIKSELQWKVRNNDPSVKLEQLVGRYQLLQKLMSGTSRCQHLVRDEEMASDRQLVLQYTMSLLGFWEDMSGGIVPVAKKVLAIPVTSSPSERSFTGSSFTEQVRARERRSWCATLISIPRGYRGCSDWAGVMKTLSSSSSSDMRSSKVTSSSSSP